MGFVYLKASIEVTPSDAATSVSGTTAQPSENSCLASVLVELSTEYPLRPPRFLLTHRLSDNAAHVVEPGIRALEQELNAGCVDILELHNRYSFRPAEQTGNGAGPLAVTSDSTVLEESLDGIFGLQMCLLLNVLPAIFISKIENCTAAVDICEQMSGVVGNAVRRMSAKNRKMVTLAGLYGRDYCA